MKKSILTVVIIFCSFFTKAQWTTNGSGDAINNNSSGKVGIGNANPQTPIDVTGNLTLRNMNNVGHGGSSIHLTSYDYNHPGPIIRSDLSTANGASSQSNLVLSSYWGGYKNEMTLINGNVGIGTSNPNGTLQITG